MHTIANLRSLTSRVMPPLLVAALFFTLYQFLPDHIRPSDAVWAPHVVASVMYDGDLYLDEYQSWMSESGYFAIQTLDGHLLSFFPVAGPLLTVPSMVVLDAFMPALRDTTLQTYLIEHSPNDPVVYRLHLYNASLIMAVSAAIMYLIGRTYLRMPYALLLAAASVAEAPRPRDDHLLAAAHHLLVAGRPLDGLLDAWDPVRTVRPGASCSAGWR